MQGIYNYILEAYRVSGVWMLQLFCIDNLCYILFIIIIIIVIIIIHK
jgi:hypothetical protein